MEKEINIRDLQLAELEILKEFIRVCKELNLKYFLDSGTLLGCVRHGGFIPWDDDIDVSMPREDYEILLEKGQDILNKKYFLQTYKTEFEYTNTFAKIRNSETTFIESTVQNLNINHGVYIDIFPFDGYNSKDKIHNIRFKVISILHKIYFSSRYVLRNPERLKIKIMKILQKVLNIVYRNKSNQDLLEKENNIAKKYKYEKSKYVCCYSFNTPSPSKHYILREDFGERNNKKI